MFYGRGKYIDAGIWARRLCELFCWEVLAVVDPLRQCSMLGDYKKVFPREISDRRIFDIVSAELRDVADGFGRGMSTATMYEDISCLQRSGMGMAVPIGTGTPWKRLIRVCS